MRRFNLLVQANSLFLALLLFPVVSFCQVQDSTENRKWILRDFSGGLNTKLNSLNTPNNQCTIAENVRFSGDVTTLEKRTPTLTYGTVTPSTDTILGIFRQYITGGDKVLLAHHDDKIDIGNDTTGAFTNVLTLTEAGHRSQWLQWHDLAIMTDGYNQPVKYDGTTATYLGTCAAVDAGSGAGPDGTYTYKVAFYTASYNVGLGVVSPSVTVIDNDINLSQIPIAPDTFMGEDIVGRKIYRIATGGSTYKLLTNGVIANNTATTLTDSDADGALGATYSVAYTEAPPKGKFCTIHNNRLWIAGDPTYPSRVYYSDDSSHDYFPVDNYILARENDGDIVTFIKNFLGVLTVGKENSISKIYTTGSDPVTDWYVSDPFTFVGCSAPYSAVETLVGIIYLSRDGIYKFDGQTSTLISDAVTPEIQNISSSNFLNSVGAFNKNTYYLGYTDGRISSDANNRVLLFNLLRNSYSIDTLSVNCFSVFNGGSDWGALYFGSSVDGKVSMYEGITNEVVHKKHSDFDLGTFDDMRYIPTRWGGDSNKAEIELSWDLVINSMSGIINAGTGVIDRPDTDGTYISPVMQIGAAAYDKLYWNERIPSSGGDINFYLRAANTGIGCTAATWSTAITNPIGADVSGITANEYVQYKIAMETDDIKYTPTIYVNDGYAVKLTYVKSGGAGETSIPLEWISGWTDLGVSGQNKVLKSIVVYYEGTEGNATIKFENYEGESDSFTINMVTDDGYYAEKFTNGMFLGEKFKMSITKDDLYDLKIKEITVVYDIEPLV